MSKSEYEKLATLPQISFEQKYKLYEASVQCPENDIEFIYQEYKNIFKKNPQTLREDFCGSGILAMKWVQQSKNNFAWGLDLDLNPIRYGMEHHYPHLPFEEQKRVTILEHNVLDKVSFKVDVIAAFNFSYFLFKKRNELLNYFKKVREGLNENGIFVLDIFGGNECHQPLVEETEHDDFTYYWDCESYNPITSECMYHIHFKTHNDGHEYKNVFTYDWRMWSIQEIREILEEASFSDSYVCWEGDGEDGTGNGIFSKSEREENCDSWVSYIVAKK